MAPERKSSARSAWFNYTYHYSGLGDRIQQTANGVTTTYVLDLAAHLTEVLSDGANTYLNGLGRIGEERTSDWLYHLPDVLGSVRQLADDSGSITFAQSYEPFGDVLDSYGEEGSLYGYTGELVDGYIKLIYLRSRYYSPTTGRFLTKDVWQGDYTRPLSLNTWNYVEGNPVNFTDPSGNIKCRNSDDPACRIIASQMKIRAETLRHNVSFGVEKPVEAFAKLADFAWEKFERVPEGFMWGMTNLILQTDPNDQDHNIWEIGMRRKYSVPISEFGMNDINWLAYNQPPGSNKSDRGDWKEDLFDGSSTQHFHFWFYAAVTYYDNGLLARGGNFYHDPHQIEWLCGEDLEKFEQFEDTGLGFLYQWHVDAGNANPQDYQLTLEAIRFGNGIKPLVVTTCSFGSCVEFAYPQGDITDPGNWIRQNLKEAGK